MKIVADNKGAITDCKGRFFRYTTASFTGQNGRFVLTQELRPLKSISCPGCAECGGLADELVSRAKEAGFIQFCPTLESGDIVTLIQVPVSRDRDTGVLEEWYYEAKRANINEEPR